jgi:DNA-binding LacI/PurR family transcriptional regulator/serine phosphatase RsbU (regulator of sigma subunit)
LVEDLANSYTARVVSALHGQAVARDVSMLLFVGGQVDVDVMRNDAFSAASPESIDALLVLSVARKYSAERLGTLLERFRPLPICTIGLRCPGLPCVQVDNEPAMRAALDHLVRHHGRRRILFLRGPTGNTEANTRFAIYRDVLRRQNIRWEPALVVQGDFDEASAERAVTDYVRTRGTDFDAVMAGNDAMALGALRALERAGARVPDSLSLIGFDDVESAWSASTPLTTVRQPFELLASTALDVVLGPRARSSSDEIHTVNGELVLRRSCGCVSDAVERAGAAAEKGRVSLATATATATKVAERWLERASGARSDAEPLIEALLAPPEDAASQTFSMLERILADLARSGTPVRSLQELLTDVRAVLRPALVEEADHERIERLFHQARILCAHAAEREAASTALMAERRSATLVNAARALLTSFDVVELRRAIRAELPRLDVPACSLLLYEGQSEPTLPSSPAPSAPTGSRPSSPSPPDSVPEPRSDFGRSVDLPPTSRCIVSYEPAHAGSLAPVAETVRTRQLWPRTRVTRSTQTIQSLFFDTERLGLLMLDFSPGQGPLHHALGEMVSASLWGARLAQRLADAAAHRERMERERLEQELEIASRIQSSILPKNVSAPGLDVAAAMEPAAEVGGDYYDVLPFADGAWIGIGDVAGHGLRPGLVMVMLQSVVAAVTALNPQTRPRDLIHVVNQVLYDNVRQRLEQNEHATLSVIRYQRDGSLSFAGAHEDLIILRAKTGRCELIPTDGTWVAATRDIDAVTHDQKAKLEPGDVLVLYTDGAIESRSPSGEPFGMERLVSAVQAAGSRPVGEIRDQILASLEAFAPKRDDDVALVVARYRG